MRKYIAGIVTVISVVALASSACASEGLAEITIQSPSQLPGPPSPSLPPLQCSAEPGYFRSNQTRAIFACAVSEVERFYSYFLDEVVDGVYADEGTFWVGPTDYVYVAYSDDVDRINPCSDPMASSFNLFHYCGYGNRLYMQADTIWYHYNQIGLAGITNIMVYELGNRARDADVSLADDSDRTLFPEAYIDEVTEFVVADGQLSPDGHDCKTGSLSAPCVPIELDGDTTEGSPQVTTTVPATADAPTTTEPNQAPETTIPNGSRGYFILDALLSGVCGDRPTTETEACVNECAQDFDSLAYCDDSIFIFFYDEFGSPITQADIDQAIDVYYG